MISGPSWAGGTVSGALMMNTVADVFRTTADSRADQVAVRTLGTSDAEAVTWSWAQLRDRVDTVAAGLHELGVAQGDRVGLLLGNRPEFHVCDLAAMMLGATSFSIYATSPAEQIEYVMADSGAQTLVTEQVFLDRVLEARKNLPDLQRVVVVDGDAPEAGTTLPEVESAGRHSGFDVVASVEKIEVDDILTLIYTSGTTGHPKGVQLTHRNVIAAFRATESRVVFPEDSRVISWLPAAHIAERLAHHYLPMAHGTEITCCPDPRRIGDYLQAVRPTWFFAVPRVWEKMKAAVEVALEAIPGAPGEQTRAAVAAAIQKVRLEQAREPVPVDLARSVAEAGPVFAGLREKLGLDQIATANVGAAPTPPEVLEFFHAIGVPVSELWGMSESTGAGCSNPPHSIRIGTIGTAAPGVEIRTAEDGEILLRGDVVMHSYRNQPELTEQTIVDGWLHTGDIGTIDADGYVTLIDRKKDLIINAMGKNMSPAFIESRLKSASPLIGQACAIGDRRPYNTALIVLDPDVAPSWAAQKGISDIDLASLAVNEQVHAAIETAIEAANARLSRVEQIKKFTIIRGDWAPSGDELTPTMKLKRRPIAEKYRNEIEEMYRAGE